MEGVREYLLSVTSAALLCGILSALAGEKGSLSGLNRMISGLFLSFLVIAPLADVQIRDLSFLGEGLIDQGHANVQEGEIAYDQAIRQIITDETRAYIMDKARDYGAEVQVQITLSEADPPIPESCVISGQLSPYAKQQLKKILISDLGIPEENQSWIR